MFTREIDQPGEGVHRQTRPRDDEQIAVVKVHRREVVEPLRQRLAEEDDVRLDQFVAPGLFTPHDRPGVHGGLDVVHVRDVAVEATRGVEVSVRGDDLISRDPRGGFQRVYVLREAPREQPFVV